MKKINYGVLLNYEKYLVSVSQKLKIAKKLSEIIKHEIIFKIMIQHNLLKMVG